MKTFKAFIAEAPIDHYDTIGNFDKSYSFKKPIEATGKLLLM